MATIRKRGPYQWQARVRRKGYPVQSMSFETRREAEEWAGGIENDMRKRTFHDMREAERTTFGEVLDRYLIEKTPLKKGAIQEEGRIKLLKKTNLASFTLAVLRSSDIASWRDERVKAGKAPTTVRNALTIISQVFETARIEWGMEGLINPVRGVPLPKHRPGRDRRFKGDEEQRLITACAHNEAYCPGIIAIIQLALETAMRQGELLSLQWENIDLAKRVATLPDTKNNTRRDVPLSTCAVAIFEDLASGRVQRLDGRVFGFKQTKLINNFRSACKRAQIENLRFHDLRHEATSRLFEHAEARSMSVLEIASMTGHKTLDMLKRYAHFEAARLAQKLG